MSSKTILASARLRTLCTRSEAAASTVMLAPFLMPSVQLGSSNLYSRHFRRKVQICRRSVLSRSQRSAYGTLSRLHRDNAIRLHHHNHHHQQFLPHFPQHLSRQLPSQSSRQLIQHQARHASILSALSDNPGAYKKKIRVGRGASSGKGKTSGRGHKGQNQHGKVKPWFEGGQTRLSIVKGKSGFINQ